MITNIFAAILIITAIVGYDAAHTPVAPITPVIAATPTPTVTPIPTDIKGYVTYKFGVYAAEALKVLECENRTFSPNAINDNTLWGGVGVDRGYWQINNVYHPVTDSCAKDVVCSTDYAWRMFVNDHYTFVRWTCGR
jgi:hypothetical protein